MIRLDPAVAQALAAGQPIVALESALISHGLPPPSNLIVAREAKARVEERGARAAMIGIVSGQPVIGLRAEEVEVFAQGKGIEKTNSSNLAWVITRQAAGSTTVSASLTLAHRAGIRVFTTGGIGGVHRNVNETFDISSDLEAVARTPVVVVCWGAKAILDLSKTFEVLETLGVPVVGYRCDELPAFISRESGIPLENSVGSPEELAALAHAHWQLGSRSALLVVVPPPIGVALPRVALERAIEEALGESRRLHISGRQLTPFLLEQVDALTGGRSRAANVALILENAGVAAEIAKSLASGGPHPGPGSEKG